MCFSCPRDGADWGWWINDTETATYFDDYSPFNNGRFAVFRGQLNPRPRKFDPTFIPRRDFSHGRDLSGASRMSFQRLDKSNRKSVVKRREFHRASVKSESNVGGNGGTRRVLNRRIPADFCIARGLTDARQAENPSEFLFHEIEKRKKTHALPRSKDLRARVCSQHRSSINALSRLRRSYVCSAV